MRLGHGELGHGRRRSVAACGQPRAASTGGGARPWNAFQGFAFDSSIEQERDAGHSLIAGGGEGRGVWRRVSDRVVSGAHASRPAAAACRTNTGVSLRRLPRKGLVRLRKAAPRLAWPASLLRPGRGRKWWQAACSPSGKSYFASPRPPIMHDACYPRGFAERASLRVPCPARPRPALPALRPAGARRLGRVLIFRGIPPSGRDSEYSAVISGVQAAA